MLTKMKHFSVNLALNVTVGSPAIPNWSVHGFSSSHVWMWEVDYKESWAPKNWCFRTVMLEKTLESPLDCKEIQPVYPKGDQSWVLIGRTGWSWSSNTLATSSKELTHWKRPWCWERLRAEGDDRGWDSWMASPTRRTWVWVDSGSWWWTGMPGVLRFVGLQRVGHDWATELNWTEDVNCILQRKDNSFLKVLKAPEENINTF